MLGDVFPYAPHSSARGFCTWAAGERWAALISYDNVKLAPLCINPGTSRLG